MILTEHERGIADALARDMASNVDANEVGKVLAFWRRWRDPDKVLALVKRLPNSGLIRTGSTRGYYRSMGEAFDRHLIDVRPEAFGAILGWAFRLMRYYKPPEEHWDRRQSGQRSRRRR